MVLANGTSTGSINIACSVHYALFAGASFSLLNRNLGVFWYLTHNNRGDKAYFFHTCETGDDKQKEDTRKDDRPTKTMASADVLKLHTR